MLGLCLVGQYKLKYAQMLKTAFGSDVLKTKVRFNTYTYKL